MMSFPENFEYLELLNNHFQNDQKIETIGDMTFTLLNGFYNEIFLQNNFYKIFFTILYGFFFTYQVVPNRITGYESVN